MAYIKLQERQNIQTSQQKQQQTNLPAWTAKQKPRTEHPKVVRITSKIK